MTCQPNLESFPANAAIDWLYARPSANDITVFTRQPDADAFI